MKTVFFLFALATGMILGAVTYMTGGILLMATGLSFMVVIVGAIYGIVSQLRRAMDDKGVESEEIVSVA